MSRIIKRKKAEPIMSEIGGKGTALANTLTKVFKNHGEAMALKIGKISSKAEKFAKYMPPIGVAVDTAVSIGAAVKENKDENKFNTRKLELKKSICEQLKEIRKDWISGIDDHFEEIINEIDGHADNLHNANSCLISDLMNRQRKIENISYEISNM